MNQLNPAYGTERCAHICHAIYDYIHTGLIYIHPRHCSACDGSRVITMAEAKVRSLPQRANEQDFNDSLIGGKILWDYCVCPKYPCRFHPPRVVTEGPHNVMPALWPRSMSLGDWAYIYESSPSPNKSAVLTVDEIRRQWEDEVLRTHGDLPDWKLAVIYAWLHNRGMRRDDTERMIREELRKERTNKL